MTLVLVKTPLLSTILRGAQRDKMGAGICLMYFFCGKTGFGSLGLGITNKRMGIGMGFGKKTLENGIYTFPLLLPTLGQILNFNGI